MEANLIGASGEVVNMTAPPPPPPPSPEPQPAAAQSAPVPPPESMGSRVDTSA